MFAALAMRRRVGRRPASCRHGSGRRAATRRGSARCECGPANSRKICRRVTPPRRRPASKLRTARRRRAAPASVPRCSASAASPSMRRHMVELGAIAERERPARGWPGRPAARDRRGARPDGGRGARAELDERAGVDGGRRAPDAIGDDLDRRVDRACRARRRSRRRPASKAALSASRTRRCRASAPAARSRRRGRPRQHVEQRASPSTPAEVPTRSDSAGTKAPSSSDEPRRSTGTAAGRRCARAPRRSSPHRASGARRQRSRSEAAQVGVVPGLDAAMRQAGGGERRERLARGAAADGVAAAARERGTARRACASAACARRDRSAFMESPSGRVGDIVAVAVLLELERQLRAARLDDAALAT